MDNPQEIEEKDESVHLPITGCQESHLTPPNPLKTDKFKPIVSNSATWRCLLHTDLISITKYRPKIVSNVRLTCLDYNNIGAKRLRTLYKSLKDAKNVSSLLIDTKTPNTKLLPHLLNFTNRLKKLRFHYNQTEQNLNKETIKKLTRLRRCPDLSTLQISVDSQESNDMAKEIMSSLSQQLRGLSHLKIFKVSSLYECWPARNDIDYYAPFLCFTYPTSVTSLTIHFQERNIRQQGQNRFLENIQHLSSLEHLDISFNLLSPSLEPQFWYKLFQRIQRIKSLRFCNTDSHSSEQETRAFLQGFRQLRNLTSLDLILGDRQTENQVYTFTSSLCQHLATFQNFKSLSMNICMDVSSKKELEDLLPSIQNLAQLERLQLQLARSNRCNCFLQSLQYLQNLRFLDIYIDEFPGISDPTVFFLASSLQKLTNLHTLNLTFPNLDKDYKSVEILTMSIAQLNLDSLGLTLGENEYFSKRLGKVGSPWESTKKLANFFSHSNLLSNLSLNLSTFDLSLRECKCLSLALKELQQLNSLALVLPPFNTEKFESIWAFTSSIKTMPKLTSLSLQFDTYGLDQQAIHDIASDLGDCTALEDLNLSLGALKFHREMFRSLLLGIAALSSLRNLQIYLGGIITNVQAPPDDIFKELKDLQSLETLNFIVSWMKLAPRNRESSQGSLVTFREKLEKYPNYKRLIKLGIVESVEIPSLWD